VAQKAWKEVEAKTREKACRKEEEEKIDGVSPTTLGQGTSRRC